MTAGQPNHRGGGQRSLMGGTSLTAARRIAKRFLPQALRAYAASAVGGIVLPEISVTGERQA